MLELRDLPDREILKRFAERYPEADVERVLLFLNLLRLASDLSAGLDRFLARHGLLQGRWWVLVLLMREPDGRSTASKLAGQAGVSRATMSGLLDSLERDGLVQRGGDPADKRRKSVRLTEAGQARLDGLMPEYYRRLNRIMSVLEPEMAGLMGEALGRLRGRADIFG